MRAVPTDRDAKDIGDLRGKTVTKAVALASAVIASVTTAAVGCTHQMPLSKEQEATISPEAATMIRGMTVSNLPDAVVNSVITEDAVKKMRGDFDASEAQVEEKIIAKYRLTVEKSTIEGIPVLIIKPAVIRPGNEDAIALNIHGGGFVIGTPRDRTALLMAARPRPPGDFLPDSPAPPR